MAMTIEERSAAPQHFFDLLKQFDFAMLVTREGKNMSARPMQISQIDERGTIWFLSEIDATRTRTLEFSPRVQLLCQSKTVYLSVAGIATVVHNRTKIDELWKESYRLWFPEGRHSRNLALIAVQPVTGEFWDQSRMKGLQFLLETARAYVTGTPVHLDPETHATATLSNPLPTDHQPT